METLEVARAAARAGGDVLLGYFRSTLHITRKSDAQSYNLVSEADVQAEAAIARVIRTHFPDHAILGEESNRDDVSAPHLWVVDPLDGTNNFIHGVPHFAVSVAYYRDGQPVCGVVVNPFRDDWYQAAAGQGATANGVPMRVATHRRLDETLVGVGFYYDRGAMMRATLAALESLFQAHIHGMRRFGTASLDLACVASGQFGAFFEYELSPWDFAAGRLLVQEAGGRVSDARGQPLPLAKSSILATNGPLHDAMLEIVQRHDVSGDNG